VNIALVNELKLLSLRMGLDIWEVIEAASTKPFGFSLSTPARIRRALHSGRPILSFRGRPGMGFPHPFIDIGGANHIGHPYHVLDYVAKALNQQKKALEWRQGAGAGTGVQEGHSARSERIALPDIIELLREQGAGSAITIRIFLRWKRRKSTCK